MLKKVEIHDIPKPIKNLSEYKMINFNKYLSSFNKFSITNSLTFENTIQVIVALLFSFNNSEQPITIKLSKEITNIEILNIQFIQMIPNFFKEYRFILEGNQIVEVFIKGLLDETKNTFEILKKNKKIDPCLNKLLNQNKGDNIPPHHLTAYEIVNSDFTITTDKIWLVLNNKFFMFLLNQAVLNKGFYAIPFYAWNINEIEKEEYFKDLKKLFKRVFFIGFGNNEWKSTYLVVSEPFNEIIHCIISNN